MTQMEMSITLLRPGEGIELDEPHKTDGLESKIDVYFHPMDQ